MSQLVSDVDLHALRRLFTLRDTYDGLVREGRKTMLVPGSTGQPRANPLWDMAVKIEQQIARLEAQFGLTPSARMALGIAVGQAYNSLDALNAALTSDEEDDGDPRLVEVK